MGSGPLAMTELLDALAVDGWDLTADDINDLIDEELPQIREFRRGVDELLLAADELLLNRVFTHRVTAVEHAQHALAASPDLATLPCSGPGCSTG